MRNLKRALSLALASVMLLGMMVVGTSAASYTDVDEKDNVEAIEVLNAVNVMIGRQGNFEPDEAVNRHEMAVIMAKLVLGNEAADNYVGSHPFTDVVPWADKYVAACYENGLIAGTSSTTYGGGQPLTAVQAAAFMLRALGYEKLSEGASDWRVPVTAAANRIRLFSGVASNPKEGLDRNQVAQLVLNALESTMVDTEDNTINISGGNGDNSFTITGGGSRKYTVRTDPDGKYAAIDNLSTNINGQDQYYIQLGEQLFNGDLVKSPVVDGMGRPASEWVYKYDSIGTYASEPDRVIVVGKSTKSLDKTIEDLNRNYDWSWTTGLGTAYSRVSLNGVMQEAPANSGNPTTFMNEALATNGVKVGDIVELYMVNGQANRIGTIAITRYSVDRLTADAATRKDGDEVRLPGVIGWTDTEDVKGWEGLKEDDVVYFYKDNDNVYHFAKAESFDGGLTAINNKDPNTYVVDGATYTVNGNMSPSEMNMTDPTFNTQYRFWTDNNGYVIYGDALEDALSDYVVIQDIEYVPGSGVLRPGEVKARLVYMDGTTSVETIKSIRTLTSQATTPVRHFEGVTTANNDWAANASVDITGSAGSGVYLVKGDGTDPKAITAAIDEILNSMFFTYTKNSDGSFELTYVNGRNITTMPVPGTPITGVALTAGKVTAAGSNIGVNDDTVFVINEKASATQNDYKFKSYTGKNNTPDLTGATISYVRKGGVVTHMYINTYATKSFSGDYVFFLKSTPERYRDVKREDGTTYGYNEYKAIVNGEYELVKVRANKVSGNNLSNNGNVNLTAGSASVGVGLFDPIYDSDGLITKLTANTNVDALAYGYMMDGTSLYTDKNGDAGMHYANTYYFDDEAPVFVMDGDGNVSDNGYIGQLSEDSNDRIYVVKASSAAGETEAKFAVIIERDAASYDFEVRKTSNDTFYTLNDITVAGNTGASTADPYMFQAVGITGSDAIEILAEDAAQIKVAGSSTWPTTATDRVTLVSMNVCLEITYTDGTTVYYMIFA